MAILPTLQISLTTPLLASAPFPLTVSITNPNPHSLTLLKWNTPLDSLAPRLGLFHAIQTYPDNDPDAGKEVPGLKLMVSRRLPPSQEDLVEILPGEVVQISHAVKQHELKLEDGKAYKLWLEGWWGCVWPKGKTEVSDEMLADMVGEFGEFRSEEVEVRVVSMERKVKEAEEL
ncbi:hypothetical protein RUND412_003782 [Rhizina undulata]